MRCLGFVYAAFALSLSVLEVQSFLSQYCSGYSKYNTLVNLIRNDRCLSVDSVFSYLRDITAHFGDGTCRIDAIRNLANHFGKDGSNQQCGCNGNNTFQRYEHDRAYGEHSSCMNVQAYRDMFNQFFINNVTHSVSDCKTHHTVWYMLDQINVQNRGGTCQKDMVYHLRNAIQKYGDPCDCSINRCAGYSKYDNLISLAQKDQCLSIDSVFSDLRDITSHFGSGYCRSDAIHTLANHFGKDASNQHCACSGNNTFQKYEHDQSFGEHTSCMKYSAYQDMFNQFFINDQNQNISDCKTHHSVWYMLDQIKQQDRQGTCQKDMVYHLRNAIRRYGDPCDCSIRCSENADYNKLVQLADDGSCMSVNSVWHILDSLEVESPKCRKSAQAFLEDKFKNDKSSHCACAAKQPLHNENIQRISNGSISTCEHSDAYREIEKQFFSSIEQYGCQDHRQLWSILGQVTNQRQCSNCREADCQKDIIIRTAVRYPSERDDKCTCSLTNPPPTTTTHNLVYTAQSSNKPSSNTTGSIFTPWPTNSTMLVCDKYSLIQVIALANHVAYPNSSSICNPDNGGSDDDFTRAFCHHLTSPTTWQKGISVMDACKKTPPTIPTYAAIASFSGDTYAPIGGQSGVFLQCEVDGFMMAIQTCNGVPNVIRLDTNGVLTSNPSYYYTIQ